MSSKAKPFLICRMRKSGIPTLRKALVSIVDALSYYNGRAKREELAKYTPARLREMREADPDSILVARKDGRLAGFVLSRYDDGLLWMAWFAVLPEYRGYGLGKALLAALEETAHRRKCHKIWCDTRTTNVYSQRVLRNCGFRQICKLPDHWYGQDFILWQKPLKSAK